jgi:hypothetical protein
METAPSEPVYPVTVIVPLLVAYCLVRGIGYTLRAKK